MTSYSGLWNNEYGENYSLLSNKITQGNALTALSKAFANRIYGRAVVREIMTALNGVAPGADAVATHKRVRAERDLEHNVLGGLRVIEDFVGIDRATTVDDKADVNNALHMPTKPAYPRDASGNGGGSKLGW